MEIEEIKQKAVAQIEAAFADTPMPAKGNYWLGPHDCEDIEAHIGGMHWKDIPLETLSWWRDCIGYLTPEAFGFYLPAYMLMVLLHPKAGDTLVPEIPVILSLSSGKSYSDWLNRRLMKMSQAIKPNEAQGIIVFLEAYQQLMKANDPYYSDDFLLYDTKSKLERGILFWMHVRDGIDVSL